MPRRLALTLAAMLALVAAPAGAEPEAELDLSPEEESVAELEAMIADIEARVKALGLTDEEGSDSLEYLSLQVEKAIGDMTIRQDVKADLMDPDAELNWDLEDLVEPGGGVEGELLEVSLGDQPSQASISDLQAELQDAMHLLSLEKESAAELVSANSLLVDKLKSAASAQKTLDRVNREQKDEIGRLSKEVSDLKAELSELALTLANSKQRVVNGERDLATLQNRLDLALDLRDQELSRFRSEFFGQLRAAIGDQGDMRIEGDRFVFQSEVLFESGSAEIGTVGERQLAKLARSLQDIARKIPADLDWVLRVDGHTDRRAISTRAYPSNWELSTDRATRVVRFLVKQGVPPDRLAATGFGEFQPLDPAEDEIAYRRNRRIEFKLTQK